MAIPYLFIHSPTKVYLSIHLLKGILVYVLPKQALKGILEATLVGFQVWAIMNRAAINVRFLCSTGFQLLWVNIKKYDFCILWLSVFTSIRSCQTVFQSGCIPTGNKLNVFF